MLLKWENLKIYHGLSEYFQGILWVLAFRPGQAGSANCGIGHKRRPKHIGIYIFGSSIFSTYLENYRVSNNIFNASVLIDLAVCFSQTEYISSFVEIALG